MSYLAQFNHKIYGPQCGRPWVFLHGLMGYGQNWRSIILGLEETEKCLAYDQRGHGRSMKPQTGYAPQDYANDLLQIVDELGWEKIVLVGHSMGGRNVLNFALRFPDRISHLVIEDIGPDSNPKAHEYYDYLLNLVPTPFSTREQARNFFNTEFVRVAQTREDVKMIANYFYSNLEEKPEGGLDWRFSKGAILESVKLGRTGDQWEDVKSLKVPTLLVRGEHSKELSREIFAEMQACNQMIKGVEIPGAGHWVHSDQPQAFLQAIKMFVGGF